jgi:ABC-2 type transport system ATP-binding protein
MIKAHGLTKRYGSAAAVSDLSFCVRPGLVTGFLGPNGAGKTTTMRLILGLDRPTAGSATVNGKPYARIDSPMHEVGALLDARAVHGGRTARAHLLSLAQTNGISRQRVGEVLEVVGLAGVAAKRMRTFSLGMSQRLGIAAALLGDPPVLIFDEPVNGLDPEGIVWIRTLIRSLALEGRTLLLSSHLMPEMEQTADHLLVIGRGRLIADCSMADFIAAHSRPVVVLRTAEPDRLARAIADAGGITSRTADGGITSRAADGGTASRAAGGGPGELTADRGAGELTVSGLTQERVAEVAFTSGIRLDHLAETRLSLEQAFMDLTAGSVDYHGEAATSRLPAQKGA